MLLRIAVTDVKRKAIVREAGAIQPLAEQLDDPNPAMVLTVLETLSCLTAGDMVSRVRSMIVSTASKFLRHFGIQHCLFSGESYCWQKRHRVH